MVATQKGVPENRYKRELSPLRIGEKLAEQEAKNRKSSLTGFIAIALVLCICIPVFLSLGFDTKADIQPETAVFPSPTASTQALDSNASNTSALNSTDNSSLITQEQALSMAMPIIQQFASENNLTLKSASASFYQSKDINGLRGGPTLDQVLKENLSIAESQKQFSTYPVWSVTASFNSVITYHNVTEPNGDSNIIEESTLMGYSVMIWADTGQIFSSQGGPLTT